MSQSRELFHPNGVVCLHFKIMLFKKILLPKCTDPGWIHLAHRSIKVVAVLGDATLWTKISFFYIKIFVGHQSVLFVGVLMPLFWTSSALGLKARVDPLACMHVIYVQHNPQDLPVV